MDIIVCVKQVPDTSEVRIDAETNNLIREGVPSIINPFDELALEWALQTRDRCGGSVKAVCMGPKQAVKELEYCLRMGVDEAVLLSDRRFAGSDTLATGYVLSQWISRNPYDLIICGAEAIDGCTGQVGPSIAENLSIPQFTCVCDFRLDNGCIHVTRDVNEYCEEYAAALPALLCMKKSRISFGKRRPTEKAVQILDASWIDAGRIGTRGSPTRVVNIAVSGNSAKSYVEVDPAWSSEERIAYIISGGIKEKQSKVTLRDSTEKLAGYLLGMPEFQGMRLGEGEANC